MTKKGSRSITITLLKTTVKKLRAKKGLESWDSFMLRLAKRGRCSIECMSCGKLLETENLFTSLAVLGEEEKWTVIYARGKAIGMVCEECVEDGANIEDVD